MLLRPGDILEGALETYTIVATISRGAYGCAFRARTSTGAWRVIKQFEPSEELTAPDAEYQRRCFEREAEILTRHRLPRMVEGIELLRREPEILLVMEMVEGETLRAVMDQRLLETGNPFDETTCLGLGRQLCEVLEQLHHLPDQLIYRDLKPSNIMWDAVRREVRLIDFGTARYNADSQQATQGLGTEGYAPPELYGSRLALSPATDVYTLGAVLYELATGQPPAKRTTPSDFRGYETGLTPAFRAAVLRALQQDPAARFRTAAEFGAALAAVAPGAALPRLAVVPRNQHPLLACSCPSCGREPVSDTALWCGFDGSPFCVAMLQIVPRHRPARVVYLEQPEIVIGRDDPEHGFYPTLDLSAADPARHISRRHARLERSGPSQWTLHALESPNPTRLAGQLVPAGEAVSLQPGARLELADLVAVLLFQPVIGGAEA